MQFALQWTSDGVVHRVPKFIFDIFFTFYSLKRSYFFWLSFFEPLVSDGLFRIFLTCFFCVHFCHHHQPNIPFHICTHIFRVHIFCSHLKYLHLCLSIFPELRHVHSMPIVIMFEYFFHAHFFPLRFFSPASLFSSFFMNMHGERACK